MIRLIMIGSFFALILNQCYGQIMTDTIFSGRSRDIDISGSISKKIIDSLQGINLCKDKPFFNVERAHIKANIPFLLYYYSTRKLKKSVLQEYDALIYTSFCGQYNFIHDVYFLEMFFEDEKKANECIKSLDKLNNYFEYAKKHDVLESKNELVSPIIPYNFFYMRKGNVVYIIHKILPDIDDIPTTRIIKNKFLEIVNPQK